jgi:hypothetical protein
MNGQFLCLSRWIALQILKIVPYEARRPRQAAVAAVWGGLRAGIQKVGGERWNVRLTVQNCAVWI